MPLSQRALGQRLKELREKKGINQQDAADRLGVPRTQIVRIEQGNAPVTAVQLSELAAHYGCGLAELFDNVEEAAKTEEEFLAPLYRISPGSSVDARVKSSLQDIWKTCRVGIDLSRQFDATGTARRPTEYRLGHPANAAQSVMQGAEVAEAERRRLGLADAPVTDFADLLSSQGIWASPVPFPDNVSGCCLRHASVGCVILVNASHGTARKRFSYAHEYAHVLLDGEAALNISSSENSEILMENRANAFAAAFLLPRRGVEDFLASRNKGGASRQDLPVYDVAADSMQETQRRAAPGAQAITYQDAFLLSRHFRASYQATVYRLRSLNLVSKDECSALLEKEDAAREFDNVFGLLYREEREISKKQRELEAQVASLAFEAYRRRLIDLPRLLHLGSQLEIGEKHLRKMAAAF